MQKLLQYSPLQAGLGMLPMMVTFAVASFASGPLYDRLGAKLMVSGGAACLAIGPFLLSLAGRDAGYTALVPGMIVLGMGLGLFFSSATTAGVAAVASARTSLAGGLIYMFQIAGGSLGLGLTTTVFTASSQSRLSADIAALGAAATLPQVRALHGILAGTETGQQALAQFTVEVAQRLAAIVRDAFAAGFQNGFRLDAALAAVSVLVAVLYIGGRARGAVQSADRATPGEESKGA